MEDVKFQIGCAYYRIALASELGIVLNADSPDEPVPTVVIETWFYQGYFKLDGNTSSCDIPHHFHVFQPCVPPENPLKRPPERGLKIPSLRGVRLAMSTLDELLHELSEIKMHGGRL